MWLINWIYRIDSSIIHYAIFFSDKNVNQTIFQNDFRIVL